MSDATPQEQMSNVTGREVIRTYQPLLLCRKCLGGPLGLGTRHRYVRKISERPTVDGLSMEFSLRTHEIWACTVCDEERQWG